MSNQPNNLAAGVAKWARIIPRGDWTGRAACQGTDPDMWFLDDNTGSYREARRICASCAVRPECLEWAIESHSDHGLFGGLNPVERRRLRRQQQQAVAGAGR